MKPINQSIGESWPNFAARILAEHVKENAANETKIAALVGALKTSIASLEWAAVAMPDIPANSTFRTDLAAAKVILAEAEPKPSA